MNDDTDLIYFSAEQVAAAHARGAALFSGSEAVNCALHASRRDGPGEVEVHAAESDLMLIRDGTATIVTGGQLIEAHEIAPGEVRALRIEGGTAQKVGPGDVFLIPRGTAHWFKEVAEPLLYYTVKIR